MGNTFYFDFEPILMEWIQNMLGTIGMHIASLFTMLGEQIVLIAVLAFIYWCYDKEFAKLIGLNVVVGVVWNPLIKNLAIRRRPYFDHSGIKCIVPVDSSADIYDISAQGYSFPSGHATNSAIIFWSLLYKKNEKGFKTIRWLLILLPILIGVSRIALGVHYPTDVVVGWIMGGGIVFILPLLQKKIEKRWLLHLIILLISLVGVFYCRTTDYFSALGVMIGFFLAVPFEERYVNFKNTKEPLKIIARLLFGFVLYFALNALLKLPFDEAFLASDELPAFLVRTARYAIIVFLVIGVYPITFDRIKYGNK